MGDVRTTYDALQHCAALNESRRKPFQETVRCHLTQELEPESAGLLPGYFHISSIMGLPKSVDLVQRLPADEHEKVIGIGVEEVSE